MATSTPEVTSPVSSPSFITVSIPTEENTDQSSNSTESDNTDQSSNSTEDFARPCLLAARKNDWKIVKKIIDMHPDVKTAEMDEFGVTILHLVVRYDESKWLFDYILNSIDEPSLLEKADHTGKTALSYAVIVGNKYAASRLVEKHDGLLLIEDKNGYKPLHLAAEVGQKEIVEFLLSKTTKDHMKTLLSGKSGAWLFHLLVSSKLYGTTLDILKKHTTELDENLDLKRAVLKSFARRSQEFASGNHNLNYWQQLIYKWIPVMNDDFTPLQSLENEYNRLISITILEDVENPVEISKGKVMCTLFWNTMKQVLPWINRIYDKKLRDIQAHELVKLLCKGMVTSTSEQAREILKDSLFTATSLGIVELVDEITKAYPHSDNFLNKNGNNLFHVAVLSRQEHVIKIINKMNHPSISKYLMTKYVDNNGNNILHLAGKLQPSSRISGAALQMQRELQWFKAIENIVTQFSPNLLEYVNDDQKTPREVFTEEHKKLVAEGRKWVNNTAQSYTVVGALIIIMTFSAAFQVPGGIDKKGPNYLHDLAFITFVISNAIALLFSCISVLMFLAILTSRYSEEDFLKSLPTKLIVGLITLCISIGCMMVAFSATLQIALTNTKSHILVAIITSVISLIVFAFLQFPLLFQICISTYGPSFLQPNKSIKRSSANFKI